MPHVLFVFGDMTEQEAQRRIDHLIGNVTNDPFLAEHAAKSPSGETRQLHPRR